MASLFETEAWFWTKGILNMIVVTLVLIIFLVELYFGRKTFKKMKSDGLDTTKAISLIIMPLVIYMSNVLIILCVLVDDFELTNIGCLIWTNIGLVIFLFNKCILYLLLILRLHIVYSGSAFAYNPKWLLLMSIILIVETLIVSVVAPLNSSVKIVYHNNVRICDGTIDIIVLGIISLVDFIVSFLTLYLFLKPLNILLAGDIENEITSASSTSPVSPASSPNSSPASSPRAHNEPRQTNKRFYKVIIKFGTLTVIMVLTTFMMLVMVGLLDLASMVVIDTLINCICVCLFNHVYDKYFKRICCGGIVFVKVFARYCCCCGYKIVEKQKKDISNLSMDVMDSQKQTSTVEI
eukprot:59227_1